MTEVTITERNLRQGDELELGSEIIDSETTQQRGGSLRLTAASRGDKTTYVVLRSHAADGERVDLGDGELLAVTSGSGMADPMVWLAVPKASYGDDQ